MHASALCPIVEGVFELRTFLLKALDSLVPDLLAPALFGVPLGKSLDELSRLSAVAFSLSSLVRAAQVPGAFAGTSVILSNYACRSMRTNGDEIRVNHRGRPVIFN